MLSKEGGGGEEEGKKRAKYTNFHLNMLLDKEEVVEVAKNEELDREKVLVVVVTRGGKRCIWKSKKKGQGIKVALFSYFKADTFFLFLELF